MYGINLQLLILSLEYQFLTMCLKSYILRKTCGFAQIAQKNCARLKFRFMRNLQLSQKIFPVLRKLRKTHCVSCAKIAQKFTKKICAKIAQILRKRFSHFVETLGPEIVIT